MSQNNSEPGHGHSVASWTTVIIVTIGFSIGTLFFWLDNAPAVWASGAVVAIAPLVGLALRKAGYGVGGIHTKAH